MSSGSLDETHLFGEVPEAIAREVDPNKDGTMLGVPLAQSKLSLRSSSPEENDKSSGIGSAMSSILNVELDQQEKTGKSNSGDLFVAVQNSNETKPNGDVDGDNCSGVEQINSLQTVVIDIENENGNYIQRMLISPDNLLKLLMFRYILLENYRS